MLGEGQTTDEMCVENFGVSAPVPDPALGRAILSTFVPPAFGR
jgi:hypothetical protein